MYLARANYKHRLRKRKALEQKRLTRRNILWIIWLNAFFPKRASTKLTAHDAYVTFFKRNRKKSSTTNNMTMPRLAARKSSFATHISLCVSLIPHDAFMPRHFEHKEWIKICSVRAIPDP